MVEEDNTTHEWRDMQRREETDSMMLGRKRRTFTYAVSTFKGEGGLKNLKSLRMSSTD